MNYKRLFFLNILFTWGILTAARELTDINLEVVTPKRGNEAKQDAFDQAVEQATERVLENLVGAEKAAGIWTSGKARILKSSTRYVVFIKGSTPQEEGGQSRVKVQMRLSPDNLETLLREQGLLGQTSVRVLPLFLVMDGQGGRYAWWTEPPEAKGVTPSKELFKKAFDQVQAKFKSKNVFVLDPSSASFRMGVPAAYRTEGLRREDQMLLGQYLKADVVLSGRVEIQRAEAGSARIVSDLQLWQSRSGRSVHEVETTETVRSDAQKIITQALEDSVAKVAQEFSGKLNQSLAAGTLNLNVVRLVVEGNLGYRQANEFRRLLGSLRDVKMVKERLFAPSRITFEVETRANAQELAKTVSRTNFPQFKVDVGDIQDNGLVLGVRALSSSSAH